jgi:hypothetical protein
MMNKIFGGRDALNRIGRQVLILGEGDFSFTLALCKTRLDYSIYDNLCSTTLDSYTEKKTQSRGNTDITANIEEIQKYSRVNIMYKIDATRLSLTVRFDVIFFTFPIHYPLNVCHGVNKHFIRDFFTSASKILEENGEIRIALSNTQFEKWNVYNSAQNWSLKLSHAIECHWQNLFVPTDGYGSKYIPNNPMWYTFMKIPRMLSWEDSTRACT